MRIFIILLWLAFAFGWIANIVKLVGSINQELTLMLILRIVGIFAAPLGAILGFL